ncbi:unnamed protein product [Durusdinium trenchii]|uniref:EF-hand domain-containing protein n=1 Tax=Durusdinium trenchii TaxID=1381693 RepID=A0ABP0RHT6_9DINO
MDALPEWFIQNLSAEELVEARREKLQHLELWQKLNAGQLYQVARKDVDELFAIFDVEGSGEISIEELMEINKVEGLVLTSSDVEALGRDADKDGSGLISAKELYKAMIQGEVAYNLVKKSINQESFAQQLAPGECLIDDLIEWMRLLDVFATAAAGPSSNLRTRRGPTGASDRPWRPCGVSTATAWGQLPFGSARHPSNEYETNSDLWSLPQTICLFAVFQWCATSHIPVRTNWRMAKNFDVAEFGSYKFSFIYDYTSLWDFFEHTFLEQHANQDLKLTTPARYFMRNQMLGASRFRRLYTLPQDCPLPDYLKKVYYPFPLPFLNKCHKRGEQLVDDRFLLYHERLDTLKRRLRSWGDEYWLDDNTTSISVDTIYMNPALGTWTFEQLTWFFENNGYLHHVQTTETFLIEPYKDWSAVIPDVLFILILMRILYFEMKEFVPAMATGLDGIMNYLQLWNIVDWLTISWGIVCALLWLIALLQLDGLQPAIEELPLPVFDAIIETVNIINKTYLAPQQLNAVMTHEDYYGRLARVFDAFQAVSIWNESVRLVAVLYLFILMLKFFKSFKANKRLNVVINTLTHSVKDVSHFAIVFATIFLCYAWAAHVFFGWSIEAASSMFGAAYWRWSGAVDSRDMEDLTDVGRVLGYAYTLSYEFLVLNLLFGILFGLVFEAYGRTRAEAGKTDTLLAQIRKSITEMRRKKDFVNDYYMICALEDEDAPAHPGEIVTIRSLLEAFRNNKMTKENAEYIINHVRDFKMSKSHEVEVGLMDALKLVGRMRTISLKSTLRTESLLKQLKDESQRPQEMRYRCIMAGFDPDNTEEMQEFIRASTLQALEEDHPLPNAVVNQAAAGPQQSKLSINSRTFSREHSSKEGTKDVIDDTAEERTVKEKRILSKADGLEAAVQSMHEQHLQSVQAIAEELQEYQLQSSEFEEELSTLERAVRGYSRKGQEGASQLEERFRDANLHVVQDLPDRLFKLSQMAKASRQVVERPLTADSTADEGQHGTSNGDSLTLRAQTCPNVMWFGFFLESLC